MGCFQRFQQSFGPLSHVFAQVDLQFGAVLQQKYDPFDPEVPAAAAESAVDILNPAENPLDLTQRDPVPPEHGFPVQVINTQLDFFITDSLGKLRILPGFIAVLLQIYGHNRSSCFCF
jgi:hypothetical protein